MQHTPSSILKRRAHNKENDPGNNQGAKKLRPRGRRVSFAPDDELATTHLFSKDPDGKFPRPYHGQEDDLHEDDMQLTEDLAARIPLCVSQQQNLPLQAANATSAFAGSQSGLHEEAVQHPGLLAMMSPGAMMSPASFSMELTNNTDRLAQAAAAASPAPPPTGAVADANTGAGLRHSLQGYEFMANITSAVPALSTLVEEDEDSGHEDSHGGNAFQPSHTQQDDRQAQQHLLHDVTFSMELTGSAEMAPSAAVPAAGQEEASPQANDRRCLQEPVMNMDLDMSPTSPFAIRTMQQHGMVEMAAAEVSDELKDKWGFTPGADDTLEMSHGRCVMGDTTYNHVYGPGSTMGDITLAMHAQQASGSNAAAAVGKPQAASRSTIAATANAAAAAAAAAAQPPGQAAGASQPDAARQLPPRASLGGGAAAHTAMHGQAEMTINLLAEDQPVGGMWRQPFSAAPTVTGHASVASNKPAPSQAGLGDDMLRADGGTTPGLLGSRSVLQMFGASAAGPSAVKGGMGTATGTKTVHNWTAQLLADGTTTAGPLAEFMHRVQQEAAATAAGAPLHATQQAHTTRTGDGNGPRDERDLTTASSSLLPSGNAPATGLHALSALCFLEGLPADNTIGSMDFSLPTQQFLANAAGSQSPHLFGDGNHTLDDFAMPPELHSQSIANQAAALPAVLNADRASGSAMKPAAGSNHASHADAQQPARVSGSQDTSTNILRRAMQAAAGASLAAAATEEANTGAGSGTSAVNSAPASHAGPQPHSVTVAKHMLADEEVQHSPALPPITLHEFLGLVEIRFLDDMRRRTSFVPPYDLALLHRGAAAGKGRPAAALTLAEALEAQHVAGVQTKLQSTAIQELADKVEALQTRTTQAEIALARGNPVVFHDAQVCGPEALEELRDRMRLLKRVCRHRTLLAWKQQRIMREQAVATAQHDALSQLQEDAATLQAALEQVLALEQALDAAQSEAADRTQQLHEQTKVQQSAREHDTLMNLRLSEMCAANEQRRQQLGQVATQQSTLQTEFEEALQRKATLRQQLQALQGQGVLRHTPEPEHLASTTPRAVNTTSGQQSLSTAEARVASLRASLDKLLLTQGLQLDLQPYTPATSQGEQEEHRLASWAVLVQGQFRVSAVAVAGAQMAASSTGVQEQADAGCTWCLQAEALPAARPLATQLLHACLGRPQCRVDVSKQVQLLPAVQQLLLQLQALHWLVEQLHDAQLNCTALTSMSIRPAAVTSDAVASQQQQQLVLSFVQAGAGDCSPCKVEVLVPCGPQLLQPFGSTAHAAGMSAATAQVCIPAARAAAITPSLLHAVQQQLACGATQAWDGLCQAVVNWMRSTCCTPAAGMGERNARPAGPPGCSMQQPAVPVFINNPLFKPLQV